jgi:DNA-binding NtrC family response regulator
LRERLEDLPALVRHLAAHAARRCNRPARVFADGAMARLSAHRWPGNIRELANLVERLTILGEGAVTLGELEPVLRAAGPTESAGGAAPTTGASLSDALEDYERRLIGDALANAGGNLAEAARSLKTDRANLHRRMRRLSMSRKDTDVSK